LPKRNTKFLIDTNVFIAAVKKEDNRFASLSAHFRLWVCNKSCSPCIKTGAIIITNDKHFEKIGKEGLIKVWNIKKAIEELPRESLPLKGEGEVRFQYWVMMQYLNSLST